MSSLTGAGLLLARSRKQRASLPLAAGRVYLSSQRNPRNKCGANGHLREERDAETTEQGGGEVRGGTGSGYEGVALKKHGAGKWVRSTARHIMLMVNRDHQEN